MDDVGLDGVAAQQAGQPEAVAPGFEGDRDASDRAAGFLGLVAPAAQQPQQRRGIRLELLQGLARQARNKACDEPALQTHLGHRDQRAMLVEGEEAAAQVINFASDGTWFYCGSPIGRLPLVQLFSSILRKDGDRYVLVTPVEKVGVRVDDAPFLAVEMRVEEEEGDLSLTFRTNVEDVVTVDSHHPLCFERAPRRA